MPARVADYQVLGYGKFKLVGYWAGEDTLSDVTSPCYFDEFGRTGYGTPPLALLNAGDLIDVVGERWAGRLWVSHADDTMTIVELLYASDGAER